MSCSIWWRQRWMLIADAKECTAIVYKTLGIIYFNSIVATEILFFFGPFFAYMLWMTENYLRQSCRTGKILCSFYYIETIETMWAEIIFRFSFQYSFDTHSKQIKLHPLCRCERGFVISVNENERKHLDQWNFCTHIYVHHIYS